MEKSEIKKHILAYVMAMGHIRMQTPCPLFKWEPLSRVAKKKITTCLFELVSEGALMPNYGAGGFIHLCQTGHIKQYIIEYVRRAKEGVSIEENEFSSQGKSRGLSWDEITSCVFMLVSEGKLVPTVHGQSIRLNAVETTAPAN